MKQRHQKTQPQTLFQTLTQFAHMKFLPQAPSNTKYAIQSTPIKRLHRQNPGILTKVKNYLGLSPPKSSSHKPFKSLSKLKTFSIESSTSFIPLPHQVSLPQSGNLTELQLMENLSKLSSNDVPTSLKHLHRLNTDYFIIGNQDQLDAVNVNCIVDDYIDCEVLWSLSLGRKIQIVTVDQKRSVFAIVTADKEILVYEYHLKRSHSRPRCKAKAKIDQNQLSFQPKFAQFIGDSQLLLLSDTHLLIYTLEAKELQRKSIYPYPITKQHNLKLFKVPLSFENRLNAFLEEQLPGQKRIMLWCLEMDLLGTGLKMHQVTKVYEIEKGLRNRVQIENYSKDVYLLNLGFEILAFMKGYVIDSVNVNIQSQSSFMSYLGSQRLIHVTKTHADVYGFEVRLTHPPKIHITPQDSIILPQINQNFQFIRVIEILPSSLALFYQISPVLSSLVGETRYKFGVTKRIPFEEKVNRILPSQSEIVGMSSEVIEQKCNVLKKMGLSNREVYLRIWNKSPKQRVEDFRFLLSTDHYETIKEQIEKKLRNSSMSYRELQKIEKVCCQMLSLKVYGADFQMGQLKNFLISSFLIKKYELYYEFSKIDKKYKKVKGQKLELGGDMTGKGIEESREQQTKVMINVQDYHKFTKADIRAMLLEYISEFCIEQKPEYIEKIRGILKNFKFCLRIDYLQLIQQIIRTSHDNLLVLLNAVPEILPFKPDFNSTETPEDPELYSGVWGDITAEQWEKNLHKQRLLTVYNKELVEEAFKSDIWYRRNWNTLHGCTFLTIREIQHIHQTNKGDEIFYLLISQVYEQACNEERGRELLEYIQTKYDQVPNHLRRRLQLYKGLFQWLVERHFEEGRSLKDFLRLQDFELFKLIFRQEKTHKNLIFSEIKPIFHEIFGSDEVFNEGLLNYFNSDLSEISDVKYLLNRMNNQKREFHIANEQTYEVLVKAIQAKIMIGSEQDTPIDEVIIYIENIPLSLDNEVMRQLRVIEQISEEADKLQEMRLNMSLYEISNNPDSVISALIDYEIRQSRITSLSSLKAIQQETYRIIAQAQAVKEKIYQDEEADLSFFIYLSKLLEHQHMLPHARALLEDRILAQYYTIDEMMVENLVLFMYKQRFAADPVYMNSHIYIEELVELLPEVNLCRQFISSEVQLAVYLSPPYDPLWYPITGKQSIISVFQLESYINNLPKDMLSSLDPKLIHSKATLLQKIASDQETNNIHLHTIYEFIILKLIENLQLREALQIIKQCFDNCEPQSADYLYPAMLLSKVFHEFCQENKQAISLCNRYLFHQPKVMVELLDDLMSHRYDSYEQKNIIIKVLQKVQQTHHVFSQHSLLLETTYTQILTDIKSPANKPQMYASFDIILIQVQRQLIKLKDEFKTFDFHIIFALLSNDPYSLVKWVFLQRFHLNLKNFRCFLSYFIKEDLFDKISVLEFGKRLFKMIHVSINEHRPIDEVIEEYKAIPITQIMEIQRIKLLENQMDKKISKSLERFKSKLKMVNIQPPKVKAQSLDEAHSKINKMVQQVKSPLSRLIEPFKYAFHDSDDDIQNKESQIKREQVNKAKKQEKNIFDAKLQRTLLMSRRLTGKQTNLYLSSEKSISPNMYFSQNFGIKGNMLNELIKSKKFPTLKKSKDQMTFAQSGSPYLSGIMKNEDDHRQFFETFPQKNSGLQKKPKRKFNIAKAHSQYVNLNDFMSFEKLVNSINRDKHTTSKESIEPLIDEIEVSCQLKMQAKTESSAGQQKDQLESKETQRYLMANRHFSKIRKISEEIHDFQGTEYPSQQSRISKTIQSQQSLIDIEVTGEQPAEFSEKNQQVQNTINQVLVNKILEEILKLVGLDQKADRNFELQLESLEQQRAKQYFPSTVKLLIEKLYDQNRSIGLILSIIKVIADKYPQSKINKQYVSIYIRMAQLHSKFNLKFPFRKVFVSTALTLEKGSCSALYSYLSDFLQIFVNEENVLKIGKVLSLGFQKSEIELEIHFILLRNYVKQISLLQQRILDANYINKERRQSDIDIYNKKIQKLEAYLEKVPANVFIQKDELIFQIMKSFEKQSRVKQHQTNIVSASNSKNQIKIFDNQTFVSIIYQALRKRGDEKIAEMLKNKWEKKSW